MSSLPGSISNKSPFLISHSLVAKGNLFLLNMSGNALFLRNFKGKVGKIRRGVPLRKRCVIRSPLPPLTLSLLPTYLLGAKQSRDEIASALTCLAMTGEGVPRNDRREVSLRPFLLSLRAEGVAIPAKQNSKIKRQNDRAKMKNSQYEAEG